MDSPDSSIGEYLDLASEAAIWQVQSGAANGIEATAGASNTIEFNNDPVTATGGYIFNTEILMRNSSPENTSLEGGANSIEDMGQDGLDIQITGKFKNIATDVTKIVTFWKQPKSTTGYTKGRFGLRLTTPNDFNINPTATF